MKPKTFLMKALSKSYKYFFGGHYYDCHEACKYDRQECNDIIFNTLNSGLPMMLTRYGSIEMSVTNTYRQMTRKGCYVSKLAEFIIEKSDMPWYDELFDVPMSRNAGVFNPSHKLYDRFAQEYLEDSKLIDILMSVNYKEKFMPLKEDCQYIHFESVYPFFVEHPWTRFLQGKRVLVIHPYADTITKQYGSRRTLLFDNPNILPEFELHTIKAVQSSAYSKVPFDDWFDALHFMENQMDNTEYDVCIIGAGAYGLPLAAHAKRMGKQAIHMGAGVQLLFGIRGRRWEDEYVTRPWGHNTPFSINTNYYDLVNEYWVRPSGDEIPTGANTVEGGCYW